MDKNAQWDNDGLTISNGAKCSISVGHHQFFPSPFSEGGEEELVGGNLVHQGRPVVHEADQLDVLEDFRLIRNLVKKIKKNNLKVIEDRRNWAARVDRDGLMKI